jgi:hypothetical protein
MAVPVCNAACQKEKRLAQLKTLMTSGPTPEAKEQARIQYFTLKDGQGWLRQEKEKIARSEIMPTIMNLETSYNRLKTTLSQHDSALQSASQAKQEEVGDEEETRFIQKQIAEANVLDRLFRLGAPTPSSTPTVMSWLSYLLDGIIALLGLYIVYLIFVGGKLNRFFVSSTVETEPII